MLLESSIVVDRVKLNWASGPVHGPPLLMFHGVLRRWQGFVPLAGALATRWHVHALDHRGHGKSDRVAGQYQVIDYIRDMAAVVSQQFRKPVVLYGHSLGAMVAMGVAAAIPDRVKAIVLEDPPLDTMGADRPLGIAQLLCRGAIAAADAGLAAGDRPPFVGADVFAPRNR